MATNSVLEKEGTKPGADGDNNHRSEGGQGENGSVRRIQNVPVTKLEGLLRALYDEDSDRFLELSVAEIRRELEKRLNLEARTLKNAVGLVELIEQFDADLTKKEKSKENKEKERLRKEKEKEREKQKSNSDRDRKSSHRSSHRSSKRRRDSDSWESDRPTKKPKRYSSSSESYDSDRKRRKNKKKDKDDPLVKKK